MNIENTNIAFSDSARMIVENYCAGITDADQAAREINFLLEQIKDEAQEAEFKDELRACIADFVAANHKLGREKRIAEDATALHNRLLEARLRIKNPKEEEFFDGTRKFGIDVQGRTSKLID